jgi:hypothetical protein
MKIRPEGTMEMRGRNCVGMFPPSRRDGEIFYGRYQTLRVWLISGCAFGTSKCASRLAQSHDAATITAIIFVAERRWRLARHVSVWKQRKMMRPEGTLGTRT